MLYNYLYNNYYNLTRFVKMDYFKHINFIYYLESIIRQLQRITNKVLEKFLVGLLYSVSSVVSICRKHGRQLEERFLVMLAVVLGYVCT